MTSSNYASAPAKVQLRLPTASGLIAGPLIATALGAAKTGLMSRHRRGQRATVLLAFFAAIACRQRQSRCINVR